MTSAVFGINLIATVGGNVGLGVASRNIAQALEKHAVPYSIVKFGHQWGGQHAIGELEERVAEDYANLPHPVNLYLLPLAAYVRLFKLCPWLLSPRRMHVASLWWEASVLPPSWIDNLSRFDAVLANSSFLANLGANGLALTPVIGANLPLAIPAAPADRARFGLPAEGTVFATSFDPNSDPARKNPLGSINAFRLAFAPGIDRVHLAIRMHNAGTEAARATLRAMTQAAAGDPRITFLLEPMTYEEVLSFYASSDVHVSLHRGEGLGLGLMESMALGKPVIATAWSGNTSFMDYSCGCPVRFRRTRVFGNWWFFKPDFLGLHAFWAEPMLDDAAHWMRKLHEEPALRLELGSAAKAAIEAYQAEAWGRRWIDQIAALWRAQGFLPAVPGKFSRSES